MDKIVHKIPYRMLGMVHYTGGGMARRGRLWPNVSHELQTQVKGKVIASGFLPRHKKAVIVGGRLGGTWGMVPDIGWHRLHRFLEIFWESFVSGFFWESFVSGFRRVLHFIWG